MWMKGWFKNWSEFTHDNLLQELETSSPLDYKLYLQALPSMFGEVLKMVTPIIQKEHMIMRDSISPIQRMSAPLHLLVWAHL
jgi:hypothetical protein